jgi:Fur family zinc uptake transcriptional regulator
MTTHRSDPPDLPRNQALVLQALSAAAAPLSAYAILDRLRGDGLRAPPQVYRALQKLIAAGRVHRLESLNAFVACHHPQCGSHETTAFAICETCGIVAELTDANLGAELDAMAGRQQFKPRMAVVELRGRCHRCA